MVSDGYNVASRILLYTVPLVYGNNRSAYL